MQLRSLILSPEGQVALGNSSVFCEWYFNPSERTPLWWVVVGGSSVDEAVVDSCYWHLCSIHNSRMRNLPPFCAVMFPFFNKPAASCSPPTVDTEYLTALQVRSKWTTGSSAVKVNEMVVVDDKMTTKVPRCPGA
ncbi:hypothetical protein FWK35_00009062 [Aphis craccivora]|uniref:DUF5641 domain-containing protein n=1 Tax=Aphis craccivora TaxID=307492 RepID=A0A6G0Z6X5_APHCR|nr:hypothetical protein FWK35_00009062 [Aphis craccivora]